MTDDAARTSPPNPSADNAEVEAAERRYRQLARSAGDLVTRHAPDGTLLAAIGNGRFPTVRDPDLSIGDRLELATHPDDAPALARAWGVAAAGREPVTISYRIERAPEEWAWVESRFSAVREESGAVVEVQSIHRDITEQHSFQHELTLLALRDPLTGLANRLLFDDRLRAAVTRLARHPGRIALLLLDLDRFKIINDSLGHSTGDRLLIEVGSRLMASVRASDTVARLSGDEFAVLAENLESAEAADILAERSLAALQAPYELEGGFTVTVTPSIGVTLSVNPSVTTDELMREADLALYSAKSAGRNRVAMFDAPLRREARHRVSVEQQARRALAAGDLFCEYQPVVDIDEGMVVLAEALVRLGDGHEGVLVPKDFLSVCEDTGLVLDLDRQVIALVLREISRLRSGTEGRCPVVSINVSSRTLTDPRFPDVVAGLLEESGLEGGGLAFELTEPALSIGGSGIDRTVASLAEMGIGIGLDKFGTGSSALSTLTTLAIDYVKLDGSMLTSARNAASSDPDGLSVNQAVVDLAHALGLAVVGQAIETAEQLAVLSKLGCGLAQGFLLAGPMPLDDVPTHVTVPKPAG